MLPPFWTLVETHGDELLAHARRLAGDSAEDVLQDALLRALRAYPRLRHAEHLRAWLYRVTTSAAIDHHRRRKREVVTDDPPVVAAYDTHDDFESLIEPLNDTARAALRLRFVDDLDYDGIAEQLGCSAVAARQRVSTAVRTLLGELRMTPLPESLLESVAAAAVREGLADALFTRLKTPIGRLLVVSGPSGIVRIAFESEPEDVALAEVAAALGPNVIGSDREMAASRDALSEYFEAGVAPDLPVDLRLTHAPFRRAVLEQLRGVPLGETVSYGELAARAGNPRAARAVGTACARNPVPIVVPCHRVLPGTGKLGAYGGGPERKRALLELEGVTAR